ncbi:MAG: transposase [Deltaproteobacteria bacterium]|nr:transposase [Deltaproteobacteria bacterium]
MSRYPENDIDFENFFKTTDDCINYLISIRWPDGLCCTCGQHDKFWHIKKGLVLQCSACHSRKRPLVGTIFHDTQPTLTSWSKAMWYLMSQKYGTNATGLSRVLGVANSTTWHLKNLFLTLTLLKF